MPFPRTRFRRLRQNEAIRRMVRETRFSASNLIYPMFVVPGLDVKVEIPSLPGQFLYSQDLLLAQAQEVYDLGIPAVLLFGVPPSKDDDATQAFSDDGVIQRAVRLLKQELPGLIVVTDVCLCEYTTHGHCGVVDQGQIVNDETLDILSNVALSHASAGADIVAPSDMMDGRVEAIREKLDEEGCIDTLIMSYAAKFASAFYGPFRDAVGSAPQFGDRRSYQLDPANRREAAKDLIADIDEGADIVMVKPALSYFDIVTDARASTDLPVAVFNVSGEYAMVKAAAANGWLDEKKAVLEIMTGIKRAGADLIITYHARDVVKWMDELE